MDYESFYYQTSNLFVVLSFYPWSNGIFLKGGGGLSILEYKYKRKLNRDINISESDDRKGYLIGLGYDFRLKTSCLYIGICVGSARMSRINSPAVR